MEVLKKNWRWVVIPMLVVAAATAVYLAATAPEDTDAEFVYPV